MDYKRSFTLRIDDKIAEKIKIIGDKHKRSMNAEIEYALEEYVNAYEKDFGTIKLDSD